MDGDKMASRNLGPKYIDHKAGVRTYDQNYNLYEREVSVCVCMCSYASTCKPLSMINPKTPIIT